MACVTDGSQEGVLASQPFCRLSGWQPRNDTHEATLMKTVNLSRGSHISAGVDRRLTVNSGSIKLTVAGEFETSCLTGEIDIDGLAALF